jgi:hypothetical protein
MKDFIKQVLELGGLPRTVGWLTIGLVAMSLYPPLSFIPKFFVLFALTH